MTGRIGPRNYLPQGPARPAKNDLGTESSGTAHPKSKPDPASTRKDSERQAATERSPRSPLDLIREEGSSSGSSRQSGPTEHGSSGSSTTMMNEILGKMGGNWKEIQRDLNRDDQYEKACDRNPFIHSHLDPDIPSTRAGKPKDNWLLKPGLDLPEGFTPPRQGGE